MEAWLGLEQCFRKVRVKIPVLFDRPDFCAGFEERCRQRPQARTDFHDSIAGPDGRQIQGFSDDVAINQKILPEKLFGLVPKPTQ